jgi:hypothetical protein
VIRCGVAYAFQVSTDNWSENEGRSSPKHKNYENGQEHDSASCVGTFIPHNEAGAVFPIARSACVIATYVFEGNVSKPRQFETALFVLPVRSATG